MVYKQRRIWKQLPTVCEEGRRSKSEGDDSEAVEIDEEEDGVGIRVIDDGAITSRHEAQNCDEDAADC